MDEDDFFWGNRRRRRFLDEDDFFSSDFGFDEFRRIQEQIDKLMAKAMKAETEGEPRSFVYGFSIKTGPDGKPIIEEFGNVPRKGREIDLDEVEPLVDVIEEEDVIKVIAEVPGVEKDDINIEASPLEVTIKVDTPKRKYFKEVSLPAEVKTDDTQASYKNGILEITLKKVEKKKHNKKKIEVK